MSGKKDTLLTEAQVRKFMKLAKLEPLTNRFINETDYRDDDDGEELDELRTGRTGALGPKSGRANPGHGRGQGEASDGSLFEEEDPDELEGDIEHDLGDDDLEGDEEAAGDELELDAELDIGDEGAPDEGRMVPVDDFLDALEVALEKALGDEVEIDADEMADDEADEEVDEFAPEGEEVVADVEIEDEMMEEGWEHPKSATGAANTHKGSKQHSDHRNKKNSKGGLASQGPGLVKEEDDEQGEKDKDDESESARLGAISKDKGLKGSKKKRQKSRRDDALGDRGTRTDESAQGTNDLVEEITRRVAARILKSALKK